MNSTPPQSTSNSIGSAWFYRGLKCSLVGAVVVTILGMFVLPQVVGAHDSFNANVPSLTRLFARSYLLAWVAPAAVVLAQRLWPDESSRNFVAGLVGMGFLALFVLIVVFALYFPIVGLAGSA